MLYTDILCFVVRAMYCKHNKQQYIHGKKKLIIKVDNNKCLVFVPFALIGMLHLFFENPMITKIRNMYICCNYSQKRGRSVARYRLFTSSWYIMMFQSQCIWNARNIYFLSTMWSWYRHSIIYQTKLIKKLGPENEYITNGWVSLKVTSNQHNKNLVDSISELKSYFL